jgi:mannosyltransferase
VSTRLRRLGPPAVGALSGLLATVGIWSRPYSLDEAEHVAVTTRRWAELVPFSHVDASGSAYAPLLKGWLHVGSSEWVARVPSVAAIALAAIIVCLLGTQLFDRRAGLVAGVAFATSGFVIGSAQLVGPLAFAVLDATLATWLLVLALGTDRRLAWTGYAVVAGLGPWLHASCSFVLVAQAAAIGVAAQRVGSARLVRVATFVAAAALPVVVAVLATHQHRLDRLVQPDLGDVARAFHASAGRNLLLLVLAGVGVVWLLGWVQRRDPFPLVLLTAWATAPLVGSLLLSVARPSLDPRYLVVSTPALALLAGVGVRALPWRVLALSAATLTLALAGLRLGQYYTLLPEDWRAAARFALSDRKPGDRIAVAPARALTAFARYAGPDRGSATVRGPTAIVVVRAAESDAVPLARATVHAPAYALLDEHSFGSKLHVQRWRRTGLPAGESVPQ